MQTFPFHACLPSDALMNLGDQKVWRLERPDPDDVERIADELGLQTLTAQLLVNRGITTVAAAQRFLAPSLDHLHDPFLILGMEQAVLRVRQALVRGEAILVYGDDDVDGITSTTVLTLFLREIGCAVTSFIPKRFTHGHGFNQKAIDAALEETPATLVIATDCGLSNAAEVATLKSRGIDTIIVDHHSLPKELPAAIILNPRLPGTSFPFIELAAVGVAFNLVLALRNHLRDLGAFPAGRVPSLVEYLDLVALGTVADVVPLVDENRVFVVLGIEELRRRRRCGVAALLEKSNTDGQDINERTICYRLAPRLNAAGRMGDANQCVELLSAERFGDAQRLAGDLEIANEKRQQAEASMLVEAIAIAERQVADGRRILVVAKEGWHQGVLGIVASRLLERFDRPTLLIAVNNGLGRGSARSPDNVDILSCMAQCEEVFETFGGHAVAAGLTLKAGRVDELHERMELAADTLFLNGELPIGNMAIDGELKLKDLTLSMLRDIERLAPFGAGNPEPAFLVRELRTLRARVVGRNHLRVRLRGERSVVDAIGFSMGERRVPKGRPVDVVLTPRLVTTENGQVEYQLRAIVASR